MTQISFIVLLSLVLVFNIKAQDSLEISQLTPVRKPTKAELKKQKKLSKVNVCPLGSDIIEVSVEIETKILSNGKKVSVIKAVLKSNELFFKETEKSETLASVNIFGRVTSTDKKVEGIFEDAVNFNLKKEQSNNPTPLFYQKIFELPERKYKLQFAVRDTQTGIIGVRSINFEVN